MNVRKQILFISEASEIIGFGHFSRSIELYKEFISNSKLNVFFLIAIDKKKLIQFLEARNLTFTKNFLCFKEWDYLSMIHSLKKNNFSCVIFDLQNEHQNLRNFFSQSKTKTISLDYFFEKNRPDVTINLFNHQSANFINESINNKKIFSGPEYAIIRNEFQYIRQKKIRKTLHTKVQNILIIMGGADPGNNTVKAISAIQSFNQNTAESKNINVVVGPLFSEKHIKEVHHISLRDKDIKIFISPKNLENLFLKSDLIFCGGGTTLLESMSVGLPAVVIPQSKEERNHACYYAEKNACIVEEDPALISSNIFNIKFLDIIKNNALDIVDQKGKSRILQISLGLING
jgi:spore coat polysaccharide biosynthesis predicted glycosyltransferase SpsG